MKKKTLFTLFTFTLAASLSVGVAKTLAEDAPETDSIAFSTLQKVTADANFGLAEGNVVKYGAKTGLLTATNSAIVDFDTKVSDNKLTLSTDSAMAFENWRWTVTNKNSIIVVFEAKASCVIDISTTATSASGWIDDTNIGIYRESDGKITEVVAPAKTSLSTIAYSGSLSSGDTLYYVFSAPGIDNTSTRNFQGPLNITADVTKTADAPKEAKVDTISGGTLQKITADASFGLAEGNVVKYGAKTGTLTATNSAIVDFDTKVSDNKLTLSTDSAMAFENWKWTVTKNNSIILVFEAKMNCVISLTTSDSSIAGWVADTFVSVYKKTGETITEKLAPTAATIDSIKINETLSAGETLYYVYSAPTVDGTRNLQNTQNFTITATEVQSGNEYLSVDEYKAQLVKYIGTLNEENYSEENWDVINAIPNSFATESAEKEGAILKVAYDKALKAINDVKTLSQELEAYTQSLIKKFNEKIDGNGVTMALSDENFSTAEDYLAVLALKDEFATKVAEVKNVLEADSTYKQYVTKLNSYVAKNCTVDFLYNLVEDTVESNFGLYSKHGIVEYGVKWGSVANNEIKDFDAYSFTSSANAVYVESLGLNDVSAKNWTWVATKGNSVIAEFKVLQNCSLDFVCTRLTEGGAIGWTVNTTLTVYIAREGVAAKKIYTVNGASTDEQFGGKYYAKAGDIIYYEFSTDHATQAVNIQTPYRTKVTIDSTGFNQESYDEQNNDLKAEVLSAIENKMTALQSYIEALDQTKYSATNWAQITAYPSEFEKETEELTRSSTVEDVENLYNKYVGYINSVQNLEQADAEFEAKKEAKKTELREYADSVLKENNYSKENKDLIEKYVADANAEIESATTTKAVNDAVTKAKNLINKVEVKKSSSSGCKSSVAGLLPMAILMGASVAVTLKKKKDN